MLEVVAEQRAAFEGAQIELDADDAVAVGGVERPDGEERLVAGVGGDRSRAETEVAAGGVHELRIDAVQILRRDVGRAVEDVDVRP